MWHRLPVKDRMELMESYKRLGYDYNKMKDHFNKQFAEGGKVELTSGGEKHLVYEKESPTGNGKGIEGHIMVNHPTKDKGKWDTIDLTDITNYKVKTVGQGVASVKKWHEENPEYKYGGMQQFGSGGKTKKVEKPSPFASLNVQNDYLGRGLFEKAGVEKNPDGTYKSVTYKNSPLNTVSITGKMAPIRKFRPLEFTGRLQYNSGNQQKGMSGLNGQLGVSLGGDFLNKKIPKNDTNWRGSNIGGGIEFDQDGPSPYVEGRVADNYQFFKNKNWQIGGDAEMLNFHLNNKLNKIKWVGIGADFENKKSGLKFNVMGDIGSESQKLKNKDTYFKTGPEITFGLTKTFNQDPKHKKIGAGHQNVRFLEQGGLMQLRNGGDRRALRHSKKINAPTFEYTDEMSSQYDPVIQTAYINPQDPEQAKIHELWHHYQNVNDWNRSYDAPMMKKPQTPASDEMIKEYYNRASNEANELTKGFKQRYPEFNMVPDDVIYNRQVENQMYQQPWTIEGEGRAVESPEGRKWLSDEGYDMKEFEKLAKRSGINYNKKEYGGIQRFEDGGGYKSQEDYEAHLLDPWTKEKQQSQFNWLYSQKKSKDALEDIKKRRLKKDYDIPDSAPNNVKQFAELSPTGYTDLGNYTRYFLQKSRWDMDNPQTTLADEEAWMKYNNIPHDNKYILPQTTYKPSKSLDKNAFYNKFDNETDSTMFYDINNYLKNKPEGSYAVGEDLYNGPATKTGYNIYSPLGNFTVGKGHDDKGDYISYYDKYDFDSAPDFVKNKLSGNEYEFYNRKYFPKNQKGIILNQKKFGGIQKSKLKQKKNK